MKEYLEYYEGKIYALSPVYVGSGEKIKKNALSFDTFFDAKCLKCSSDGSHLPTHL